MRYLFLFVLLCFLGGYNSSCKKGAETIIKTDTLVVKDTVRDTIHTQLIRTDRYTGLGQLDCLGGCPNPPDLTAYTDVSYYANDSTSFSVHVGSGTGNKEIFDFSIVKGIYKGRDANLYFFELKGPDSLKYYGAEYFLGMGTMTYDFHGKRG
jgi:hypothetical protein